MPILAVICAGCSSAPRVQDQSFRDYLTFQDICRNERHLKEQYCDNLWQDYIAGKAKLPPPQEIHYQSTTVVNEGGEQANDPVADYVRDSAAKIRTEELIDAQRENTRRLIEAQDRASNQNAMDAH